jgi:hypothetical protein
LALGRRALRHGWKLGQFDVEFVVRSTHVSRLTFHFSLVMSVAAAVFSTAAPSRRSAGWARR